MAATKSIQNAYKLARETYAELGVDAEAALRRLRKVSISLHCWQGDDVGGYENAGGELGGGLAVTGNYPGKARTPEELRADLDKAYSLIPGTPSSGAARHLRGNRRHEASRATKSPRPISKIGSTGPKPTGWGWISTPPASPIPRRRTVSPSPTRTRASGNFGSSTASPPAKSARPWAGRRATRA